MGKKKLFLKVSAKSKSDYVSLSLCSFLSWVVFEEPGFCGESYILEKGLYGSPEDWGALQPRVASALPVLLVRRTSLGRFGCVAWVEKCQVLREM